MAQFPGFAPAGGSSSSTRSSTNNADVGMTDAEDDESATPLEEAETPSISISRTADHFGKSLRISPPKLSIPNPARNYFAISAIVDPTFSAPPLPPDDDEMISSSSTSAEAGAPQVLPMTPVYYPPPAPLPPVAVAVPVPAPVPAPAAPTVASSNYSLATPASRDPNVDTPRPKPPPRNKVPLEKGYSQMVWLRLMQSEPDLAGLKGESARRLLTMDEIKKHRSEGEAWTILRGRVYNISPYLKFHPGGPEMLMKAAGIDCTALFNKYHAWVNAEFLLEKCLVGLLDVQGQGDK